jgi:hypothetical protein
MLQGTEVAVLFPHVSFLTQVASWQLLVLCNQPV